MMINEPSNLKLDLSTVKNKEKAAEMRLHQTLDLDYNTLNEQSSTYLPQPITTDKFLGHVKQ